MIPTYLDDEEEARNRSDKSILAIKTMRPEKLLVSDVAFPEQVKELWLYLSFEFCDYGEIEKYLFKKDCECIQFDNCIHCSWQCKYTDTLCKDLVNFNHLETLTAYDLNLSNDLWTQFAQNSKCLKNITFGSHISINCGGDSFYFSGENDEDENKNRALDAVFKIPTLESISFTYLDLPYFPKGPSNIKKIKLDRISVYYCSEEERKQIYEYYYNNFSTHTNITDVYIEPYADETPFKFSTLRLEEMKQLEELTFTDGMLEDQDDLNSLKAVLNLPKLKNLKFNATIGKYDIYEGRSKHPRIEFNGSIEDKEKIDSFKAELDLLEF